MDTLNYINNGHGIASWLLTKDHKRIALLYLISVTAFFAVGGFFALLVRLELLTPAGRSPHVRDLQQDVHHARRGDGVLLPDPRRFPAALGNFLIPIMIGAKDLAFPRINLLSWYIYILGGLFTLIAALSGGVDTGWTFYTPYSTTAANSHVIPAGARRLHHRLLLDPDRAQLHRHDPHACARRGMTWFRLPLFVWAHYATSLIMILGTPVLAITILLRGRRTRAAHRDLRSRARRRPGALPAPLLVLLAPGRLHHDPAGDGRDQRDRSQASRARTSSATRSSRSRRSPSRSSASWSGATTCSSPASRSTRG